MSFENCGDGIAIYDQSNRLIGVYGTTLATSYAEHVWLTPDLGEAEGRHRWR